MKITFLTPTLEIHGGTLVLQQYANYLVAQGHSVTIISPNRQPISLLLDSRITVKLYPAWRWRYLDTLTFQLGYYQSIIKLIEPTDLIIPIYLPLIPPALIAVSLKRLTALVVGFGQDSLEMIWVGRFNRWLLGRRWLRRGLTGLIAVSAGLAQQYHQLTRLPIEVIPNGVDHTVFYDRERNRENYLLFVGRPHQAKGFPTFLGAFQQLANRYPKLTAKVVSPTKFQPPVKGIEAVTFTDRNQLAELYARALICVVASPAESFGLPGLEAMASATPLVTTDTIGSQGYARHKFNCLVVPINDSTRLAEAVNQLICQPALAHRLVKHGLATSRRYNWSRSSRQLEQLLKKLVKLKQ